MKAQAALSLWERSKAQPMPTDLFVRLARRCLPEMRAHPGVLEEKIFPGHAGADEAVIGAFVEDRLGGLAVTDVHSGPRGRVGGVRILLVDPLLRRRGIGTSLVRSAEARFRQAGAARLWLYASLPNYLYPGAPSQDSDIAAFARALGYEHASPTRDMGVDLALPGAWQERPMPGVRRVGTGPSDVPPAELAAFAFAAFPQFAAEVEGALRHPEPIAHVATAEGRIVGFCVAGSNNLDLGCVGPAGVLPESRGGGAFRDVLSACLRDLKARGHGFARMQWADPRAVAFYRRWFDGFICGEYLIYGGPLPAEAAPV
ncbi:MAG TPA: GNAT family N-acetyltransferase [Allosphingosinicella sp.]|jgi:GNAT superfamily N-acetyltransferase